MQAKIGANLLVSEGQIQITAILDRAISHKCAHAFESRDSIAVGLRPGQLSPGKMQKVKVVQFVDKSARFSVVNMI